MIGGYFLLNKPRAAHAVHLFGLRMGQGKRAAFEPVIEYGTMLAIEEPSILPERLDRIVRYAGREELIDAIWKKYHKDDEPRRAGDARKAGGNLLHEYDEMIGSGTAFPVEGREGLRTPLTGRRERPGARSSLKI